MTDNLFRNLPAQLPEELTEVLAENREIRIERIVSTGQRSADRFWYDQHEDEWVLLLQGSAVLQFESQAATVRLETGDYLHIPAHKKHRILQTATDQATLWLAIFSTSPLN